MTSAKDLAKAIESIIGANDEESTVTQFLDTGFPPFNYALTSRWDGGFPVGRIVEMSGPPSAGKTAVATTVMAAAQKAGGIAGFCDHERSFSKILAPRLGLDVEPGRFVFKKPRTFEESLTICVKACSYIREKKLIAPDAPIAWVFDSLASMVPMSALFDMKTGKEKDAADRTMNDNTALARATSAHFPAFSQHVEELNICAIFLNQVRTKIGVLYGDPRVTPGGDAPKFYASQRIMLGAAQIKKGTDVIGSEVTANVIKNKVARPFLRCEWRFMFNEDGTGRFDYERSLIEFLDKEGLIPSPRKGFVSFQGKAYGKEELARLVEKEGLYKELVAMLPAAYEPPVVAEELLTGEEEAA